MVTQNSLKELKKKFLGLYYIWMFWCFFVGYTMASFGGLLSLHLSGLDFVLYVTWLQLYLNWSKKKTSFSLPLPYRTFKQDKTNWQKQEERKGGWICHVQDKLRRKYERVTMYFKIIWCLYDVIVRRINLICSLITTLVTLKETF